MNKRLGQVLLLILLVLVAIQLTIIPPVLASDPVIDKKTDQILGIFSEISAIPRCSGKEKGIRNFFVIAPNLTIYDKLIADFTYGSKKYVFR